MMSTYGRDFAEVYDSAGFSGFSERMIPYIDKVLKRLDYRPKTLLDLACGTGTAAIILAKRGLKVYGVDISLHMLRVAERKAEDAKVHIKFTRSDMINFILPEKVDLVISLFDSINYLVKSDKLLAMFERVRLHLKKGGLFLFDFNTLYTIKYVWDNSVHISPLSENLLIIESNTYNERSKTTTKMLTLFAKQKKEIFKRICEKHVERGYTLEEIKALLIRAGFGLLNCYDCFTFNEPKPETRRIFCVGKKVA